MKFSQMPSFYPCFQSFKSNYEGCMIVTYTHTMLSCLAVQSNERPGRRLQREQRKL